MSGQAQSQDGSGGDLGTGDARFSRRLLVRLAVVGVVVAALVVGAVMARTALMDSWYVGASGSEVAIFRGVPGTIAGMRVSKLDRRTGVPLSSLIEIEQERVRDGKTADSLEEAQDIVRNLQHAPVLPATSPSPDVSPGPAGAEPGASPAAPSPQVPPP